MAAVGRRSTGGAARKPARRRDKIAGIPEYAALEFEAFPPEQIEKMTDRKRWDETMQTALMSLHIAAAAHECDHLAAAAKFGAADKEVVEGSIDYLTCFIERLGQQLKIFEVARLRIMAGAARHLVASDPAAASTPADTKGEPPAFAT